MNTPLKIIHKYKNFNKKIQYNILIFVGSLLSESLNNILLKIKDKNLFNSLTELNDVEINLLIKQYGEYWYTFFFPNKHIKHIFDNVIESNKDKKKIIIDKFNQEWYDLHISHNINYNKTLYSYQTKFRENTNIKLKLDKIKFKDFDYESYKINNTSSNNIYYLENNNLYKQNRKIKQLVTNIKTYNQSKTPLFKSKLSGHRFINLNSNLINKNHVFKMLNDFNSNENDNNDEEINLTEIKDNLDSEENNIDIFDITELENLSKEDIYIKDINKETQILQDIIEKTDKETNDIYSSITEWNESNDNNMYDEDLINIYKKTYIYNQYILIDDTIKVIKKKICCGYSKSKKINNTSPYFIPSTIYLWSEYSYYDLNNKLNVDKIMIGQKWIKGSELLDIDIEPNNNLTLYEDLYSNLKNLQNDIKRYGSKIIFENDENNILLEYDDYIINNEIYMLDVYNELGINYNQSNDNKIKNLYDVYIKIYFPNIIYDELIYIINYLKKNTNTSNIENEKIISIYKNINNDILMENEILKIIEKLKYTPELYVKYFKDNYVTQAVIHINIKYKDNYNLSKVDLYRIFDNFITNDKYPFIQYQTQDSKLIFKLYTNINDEKTIINSKWFETAPYGISFKVKINELYNDKTNHKYISININDTGRIEYKTQWKEEDYATIDTVKKSYIEIKELLKKINNENSKIYLEIPSDDKFKFAFINTILQFELPDKYIISHNDLSDFSRNFYPYVAVVLEPRRREAKKIKKLSISKYGTYLRYKRISKYENEADIEKRILYFLKNYEFNEKLLINEISKQFNISDKEALRNINNTINKFPNVKKSRNILKKFEDGTKYKLPGIGIDIQGKEKSKYKIRITGARSKYQLDNIISFMNILLYLYIETYLYNNPETQYLKNKLKLLTNIAKRRNKVLDIIEYKEDVKNIKKLTQLDKNRLAYKPEKGQNQWSRNCQNSGDNKKRRPLLYTEKNLNDMIDMGYIFNNKTGEYERKIKIKNKDITLKAAKITNIDTENNDIYYTCNPEENGEYTYIGFLSRSANPHGLCMPCCYKKDNAVSKNKEKRMYHLKCLGKPILESKIKKIESNKLYILQDNIRVLPNRYSYLPLYLDIFLNNMLNKKKNYC